MNLPRASHHASADYLQEILREQADADVLEQKLHRHLERLTNTMLIPLEQYLARLMPLRRDVLPFEVRDDLPC